MLGTNATALHPFDWAGGDDVAWHHYVNQRSGTRIEIWRDGVLGFSDDQAGNAGNLVGDSLYIGKSSSDSLAAGTVDGFRVYDRALSEVEIQGLTATG